MQFSIDIDFLALKRLSEPRLSSFLDFLQQSWVLLLDDSCDVLQSLLYKHVELLPGIYPKRDRVLNRLHIALLEVQTKQIDGPEFSVLLKDECAGLFVVV